VHEGFRQQLAGIFDVYRDHLAEAIHRGQKSGRLRPDADAVRVAQFLVGALEGAILLGKVTRDITVIERCVEELKVHLALYRN
jgi:TetR/AcrR family transcriptional repressor of nem operon